MPPRTLMGIETLPEFIGALEYWSNGYWPFCHYSTAPLPQGCVPHLYCLCSSRQAQPYAPKLSACGGSNPPKADSVSRGRGFRNIVTHDIYSWDTTLGRVSFPKPAHPEDMSGGPTTFLSDIMWPTCQHVEYKTIGSYTIWYSGL